MPAVNAGRQKTSAGTVSPPFRPAPDLTEAPLSDFAVSLRSLENAAYPSYPCRASEKGVKRIHPTQKPVMLMGWLIERAVPVGGLVVDPYAGSCSTLIAARLSGRFAIGVEADHRHIASAIERLSNGPA